MEINFPALAWLSSIDAVLEVTGRSPDFARYSGFHAGGK